MRNKVILKGNVGRSPRVLLTQEGKEIVSFSLATKATWKDESGEWQSTTDWHQITVFRESTVRWVKDLLKRGDPVSVEGKLTYQHWTDKFNQSRFTPHVVITKKEGKVEHFPFSSNKKGKQSSNLSSNQNLADSNSKQEVLSSNSEENEEDSSFELLQEQIHPEPMHPKQ